MSAGIFNEGFPYSNFHDLNMDWIIKIAKDFLDQYTHIQQIIEQGKEDIQTLTESGIEQIGDLTATSMQQLQDKADELEGLLQQWYNTHSQDIADALADALEDLNTWYTTHQTYLDQYLVQSIADFNTATDAKLAQVLDSIPADYSELSAQVAGLETIYGTKNRLKNDAYAIKKASITFSDSSNISETRFTDGNNGFTPIIGHKYIVFAEVEISTAGTGFNSGAYLKLYGRNLTANSNFGLSAPSAEFYGIASRSVGEKANIYGFWKAHTTDSVGIQAVILNAGTNSHSISFAINKVYFVDISDLSFPTEAISILTNNVTDTLEYVYYTSKYRANVLSDYRVLDHTLLNNVGWTQADDNYCTTAHGVPVKPNTTYCVVNNNTGRLVQLYKGVYKSADEIYAGSSSPISIQFSLGIFTTPDNANAKYLFFTAYNPTTFDNVSIVEGISWLLPESEGFYTYGKHLMTLGDSLTEGGWWQAPLLGKLGFAKFTNLGVGGTAPYQFANNVDSTNIADVDVVTIMGFFNGGQSVGSITDPASNDPSASMASAYKYLVDKILTLKPSVNLILITPHCPSSDDGQAKATMVKEIAHYYKIPCIDVYFEGGFNEYTFSTYLKDVVHSSDVGYEKESVFITGQMNSLLN